LKHEFEELSWRYNEYKKWESKNLDLLESKIANETHTIEILLWEWEYLKHRLVDGVEKPVNEEKKEEGKINGLVPENQEFLRQIKWAELFSKKSDIDKERELDKDFRNKTLSKLNDAIINTDV